jgi:hypothetical protein
MKTGAVITLGLVASVQGFAPASQGRAGTQLQETLFDKILGMDLFAPVKEQNDYGARGKKNVSDVFHDDVNSAFIYLILCVIVHPNAAQGR